MSEKPLQRVGEIELAGGTYDVARNGEHFHIVGISLDDYGRPVARKLDLNLLAKLFNDRDDEPKDWHWKDLAQVLVDALGEKMVSLEGRRAMQHQREIEP